MKLRKIIITLLAALTVLPEGADAKMKAQCGTRTVVASSAGIILDSDVYNGGGTDQTARIQAILDKAEEWGRLYFIMDGAALVSKTLRVHSNTTIYCPDKSCGFFLADGSDCSVISNYTWGDYHTIVDHDITLLGGVYNNNSPGQVHDHDNYGPVSGWVYGMEWYGVENLTLKDLAIVNQRTFACTLAGWKHLVMENIHIDRRERPDSENQDGIHLFGPGQHASLKNIYGNVGDDFIAVAPDEVDLVSSITDVLIDGVYLDDADQGIRILCRENGRVDRVTVRNVSGTYRSYGFIVNPWFEGCGGSYGNIVFDNIDLRPLKNNYSYTPPFLFKIGGNIESLTLRNIYWHRPSFFHRFAVVGGHYMMDEPRDEQNSTRIGRLIVDGIYVEESSPEVYAPCYFSINGADVDLFYINDIIVRRPGSPESYGSLIKVNDGSVGELLEGPVVSIPCLNAVLEQ